MKKVITIGIFIQIMLISVLAQNSTEKVDKLKQTNQLAVEKYRAGDFKEATEVAQTALELTIEMFGAEHKETAISYNNLGEIYKLRKKYSLSFENFEKALEIYQLNPKENAQNIVRIMENIGVVLTLDGKFDEAEKVIETSVKRAEKLFGNENENLLPYIKTATDFHIITKNYGKAEKLFARRHNITQKVYGKDSEEVDKIEDEFFCYTTRFSLKEQEKKRQQFFDLTNGKIMSKTQQEAKFLREGIVNGKAIALPKPAYPYRARQKGARGTISIRVNIDENGGVISAKSICGGDEDLQRSSEEAAMRAKFKPTLLENEPVRVTGVIIYIFN